MAYRLKFENLPLTLTLSRKGRGDQGAIFIHLITENSRRAWNTIHRMNDTVATVAIIGAGRIGLELAVALKRKGVDYLHFDAKQIGHTISWFAPQTRFFSSNERIAIAGVPMLTYDENKATREEYLAYLRLVVKLYDLKIKT